MVMWTDCRGRIPLGASLLRLGYPAIGAAAGKGVRWTPACCACATQEFRPRRPFFAPPIELGPPRHPRHRPFPSASPRLIIHHCLSFNNWTKKTKKKGLLFPVGCNCFLLYHQWIHARTFAAPAPADSHLHFCAASTRSSVHRQPWKVPLLTMLGDVCTVHSCSLWKGNEDPVKKRNGRPGLVQILRQDAVFHPPYIPSVPALRDQAKLIHAACDRGKPRENPHF